MDETGEIRGERVRLRHMVRADIDQMARWPRFREPEYQWANLELTFPSERDAYYERGRTNATRRRFVILAEDGEIIGTLGLRNLNFERAEGTLGIIIRADRVGRGYGTDAVRAALGYAFDTLGLDRVFLDVAENNHRARRVYEKLGFLEYGQHPGSGGVTYLDMVLDRSVNAPLERSGAGAPAGKGRRG